ncbi:glucose 1-dehydrogenase [Microbaculum marinisediminis]|uniref:Glucose 1-dehydrogenase n=1 Tax=Microbaculum marinisediminis TaxID=2931392 RepID=A0AAW5R0V8_9HYPH|nr:glucose 1-dehydrogenase [Microbaculum sp. A6E488]MCT8972331.1 glucose 1-dehydrogenase [Microbaculum sp. A6E488]
MTASRLKGKRAFITGAAGGIGSAIAHAFVSEGARVMLTDLDGTAVQALAGRVNDDAPGAAAFCAHDVTSESGWAEALETANAALGGIDVLVNNAGIWAVGSVEETDPSEWRRCMGVNLDSVYLGMRLAIPYLRESQPASIVNVSSVSGLVAGHNVAAYNTAKAGMWMLTKSTALHCAHRGDDIRANSIHPTFIETGLLQDVFARGGERQPLTDDQKGKLTRQIPLKRLCTVEDVAYAAIYLASDESRYMTASEIKLDGGLSAM